MYKENTENLKKSVEEDDTEEALPEQLTEDHESDRAPDVEEKTMDGELLNHCRCHIVEGRMHWFCDKEVYRDRLVGLLGKEPFIELETKSSLDE